VRLSGTLPQETARYVPRFLAALHIVKEPERYGFSDLQVNSPLIYEKVQVNRQMLLRDVARALGLSHETLEELNPSLRYKATPNYTFTLNVPKETRALLLSKLENIPLWQPPKLHYVVHRVRRGQTLSGIARTYRVPIRRIVRANNLRSASRIREGQRLKIPLRGQAIMASTRSLPSSGSTIAYRVKRGDSLWLIAKRFNTTVADIKALNGIDSNMLQSGQMLKVQTGKP